MDLDLRCSSAQCYNFFPISNKPLTAMADVSLHLEPVALAEVSDNEEVALAPSDDEEEAAGVEEEKVEKGDGQVNGVMVLSLLDKIIGAVDQIQQTQTGLEARQQDMERSVTGIQSELAKLSKSHTTTSNSVNKMLEKVRKVSVNVKTVRTTLEKQAGQIKKLESNENELLKRRNFKVMIYQVRGMAAWVECRVSGVACSWVGVGGGKAGGYCEQRTRVHLTSISQWAVVFSPAFSIVNVSHVSSHVQLL